jgi:CheY-like chemotaxis protein
VATILFADDSANIREFLKQELEEEGYRVLLARDGTEALDLVQSERPDLAILDIWMPQLNGLEAAARINAIAPGVRVILFTNNDELCMRDPRSVFAAACIEKGEDLGELKRTIVSVLASRRGTALVRLGLPPIHGCTMPEPRCELLGTRLRGSRNR